MRIAPRTRTMIQVTSTLLGMIRRKYDQPQKSKKMSLKQPKLKVIIHVFGLSRGPSSERNGMPPRGYGRSLERRHVAWNEYMDAYTFISRQFYASRKNEQIGC